MNPQMVWFQGVVEDRNDPLQLGRVKVRCVGYHTEKKQDLPTEDLPWAHPVQPITSAGVSGIGTTPLGPVEGTWVVGFFRDGMSAQNPVIFGTLGALRAPSDLRPGEGFQDPNGNYPLDEGPNAATDTNSLARGAGGVPVETRLNNLDGMLAADPDIPYSFVPVGEPPPRYAAQYPFNHVKFTESGHVEEFDDTPGAERIHTYHRAGTFEEIHPDGSKVIKVVGDEYELYLGKKFVHITGNTNILIGPSEGEATENIGNLTLYVKGDADIQVDGDADLEVGKNLRANVSRQVEINSGQNMSFVAEGNIAFRSGGNFVSVSDKETKFVSSESVTIKTEEKVNIGADDDVIVKGNKIRLN